MVGDLAGYGTVWYHRLGIANILSLAKVKGESDVRFNSGERNCFEVEKKTEVVEKWFSINHKMDSIFLMKTKKKMT